MLLSPEDGRRGSEPARTMHARRHCPPPCCHHPSKAFCDSVSGSFDFGALPCLRHCAAHHRICCRLLRPNDTVGASVHAGMNENRSRAPMLILVPSDKKSVRGGSGTDQECGLAWAMDLAWLAVTTDSTRSRELSLHAEIGEAAVMAVTARRESARCRCCYPAGIGERCPCCVSVYGQIICQLSQVTPRL